MSVERTPHRWEHVLPYTTNAVRCLRCGLTFVAVADLSRADTGALPRLRWCGSPNGPLIGNRLPRWCSL